MSSVLVPSQVAKLDKYVDLKINPGVETIGPPILEITVRGNMPDGRTSLIDFTGDRFFTYNHLRNSICVGNVKDLLASSTTDQLPVDQELPLTTVPWFQINQLSLHPATGELCLLWGKRGIFTTEFGQETLQLINEKFLGKSMYASHTNLIALQCRWVPMVGHKVLLVLNSDCFLRVYNIETSETLGCFNLGPQGCLPLSNPYCAEESPERPVDFDFGPFFESSKSWALFVLKPTGTVFCAIIGLVGSNIRCLMNSYTPLHIFEDMQQTTPGQEDFSSILSSKQFPVIIITGQQSGQLTHSVLLPATADTEYEDYEEMEGRLINNDFILYTKERLKLQIPGETLKSGTLHLLLDPLFEERYICVHGGGVHLITIKFLSEILKFFESDEDSNVCSLSPSVCRELIVWKFGDRTEPSNKIVGISFSSHQPQKLLCVLRDKTTVIFSMPHPNDLYHLSKVKQLNDDKEHGNDANNLFNSSSVLAITRSMLRNSADQPFLCSDQDLESRELSKFSRITIQVKLDQMQRLSDALNYIWTYTNSLDAKTDELKILLINLLNARAPLKDIAESMAERYEERLEKDEMLTKRMEAILFRYHQAIPIITDKEKSWQQAFEAMKDELLKLKTSAHVFNEKSAQLKASDPNLQVKLNQSQVQQIQEEIANQQKYIVSITTNLREIKAKLVVH